MNSSILALVFVLQMGIVPVDYDLVSGSIPPTELETTIDMEFVFYNFLFVGGRSQGIVTLNDSLLFLTPYKVDTTFRAGFRFDNMEAFGSCYFRLPRETPSQYEWMTWELGLKIKGQVILIP